MSNRKRQRAATGGKQHVARGLEQAEEKTFTKPVPKGVGARVAFLLGRAKGSTRAVAERLGVSQPPFSATAPAP